jgi:hypothetical protein
MKKLLAHVVAGLAALVTTAAAGDAGATNFTLWIHGRTGGTPNGWSYWVNGGGHQIQSGVNAVPVNYDGTAHIHDSNPTVVGYLNAYCTGQNACYIVCHSAGCAQIGYATATYGHAWNIIWTATGGSAAGGSELAGSVAYFFTGYNLDLDLPIGTMRGLYNHDALGDYTAGRVYNAAGSDWATLTTFLFNGNDDSAVDFASAGHYRSAASLSNFFAGGQAGGSYWDYSQTSYAEPESHCTTFKIWGTCMGPSTGVLGHCIAGSYPCQEGNAGGIMGWVSGWVAPRAI